MLAGCGGVSSGLVCLYLKCMLMAESFPVSEDRLTLKKQSLQSHPDAKALHTHNWYIYLITRGQKTFPVKSLHGSSSVLSSGTPRSCLLYKVFSSGSVVKNPPAMQERWQEPQVWFLGWEDPLEKRKQQPTPVFLPGEFHGPPTGLQKSRTRPSN